MASTISAGLTTTTALVYTADTSGVLQLQTNGTTTAVTINTSQQVGIGTASPSNLLSLAGTTNTSAVLLGLSGTGTGANIQTIANTGGRLAFGIENSAGGYIINNSSAYDVSFSANSTNINWSTNNGNSTQMKLDTSGNLLVGTTTNTGNYKTNIYSGSQTTILLQSSTACADVWNNATSGNNVFLTFYTEGSGTARGSITYNRSLGQVAYNITSDRRLKSNIEDLTNSGTIIDSLKPRTYTWIETNQQTYGFIADEFQVVFPHAVQGEANATKEEEYEVTPAVKDEQGNITTPAVMGTRTVPVYQQVDVSSSEIMANIIAELQSLRARLKAANIA